jgi:hypothetical protein
MILYQDHNFKKTFNCFQAQILYITQYIFEIIVQEERKIWKIVLFVLPFILNPCYPCYPCLFDLQQLSLFWDIF